MAASLNSNVVTDVPYTANFLAGMRNNGQRMGMLDAHTFTVAFGDLGSGASSTETDSVTLSDVIILSAHIEVDTVFAGEADLAVIAGRSGDTNGLIEVFTLHNLAVGVADSSATARGADIARYYKSYNPILTFTATELDDVSAGQCTLVIHFIQLELVS